MYKVGRVADADVVEDGLIEDVPSSIVGYQKLRGALVCGQEPRPYREGGRQVGVSNIANPSPAFIQFLLGNFSEIK